MEFWFDFASTYSYPTSARIAGAASAAGVTVKWRAILLGPIFQKQGWDDSPFNLYPAKGRYMWTDLRRICTAADIPYTRPSVFPRNGLLAARIACAYDEARWLGEFVQAVFHANFVDDADIADPAVVTTCLEQCGADAAATLRMAQSPEAKAKLRERTAAAEQAGIFGAPTFLVGDELFWGNDRLDAAIAAAADYSVVRNL